MIWCIGFMLKKKIPNVLQVCDDIISRYKSKVSDYSLGEDTTYMEGEDPHYHLNMVCHENDVETGKVITKRALEKIREQSNWKFGQDMHIQVKECTDPLYFLAYACKESRIKVSLADEAQMDDFYKLSLDALAVKIKKHEEWKKEELKKKAKKDLKDIVLDYMSKNYSQQADACSEWMNVPGNADRIGYRTEKFDQMQICRIVLERFQLEHKKHFRQFEIERYICEYFRNKYSDPIEMFILRNCGCRII